MKKSLCRILSITASCLSLFALSAGAAPASVPASLGDASLMSVAATTSETMIEVSSDPELLCQESTTYSYCSVVRLGNGGNCIYNTWQQTHHITRGALCPNCEDAVDPNEVVRVGHYTTSPPEPCVPSNDCQVGAVTISCNDV